MRPTYGRYPGEGTLPITQDKFDKPGPLARSVSDLVLFDQVAAGDPRPIGAAPLAGARLGIAPSFFFEGLDEEVEPVLAAALSKLESAGATIVKADLPKLFEAVPSLALTIGAYELLGSLAAFLAKHGAGVNAEEVLAQAGVNMKRILEPMARSPNPIPEATYQDALRQRDVIRSELAKYFREGEIDALVFPPVLCAPPALGDNAEIDIRGKKVSILIAIARNTALSPYTGLPGLVLPAGMTKTGLPVGIEFDALPGRDRELLALGLSAEDALGPIPAPTISKPSA